MKTRTKQRKMKNNDSGDVGVGTLIIFISMVLVAAVAATVLIYTTGALQQKATKTSSEATQQISSNIIVEQALGNRSDGTGSLNDSIQSLILRIKPAVGTTAIDLKQVVINVMDKDNRYTLNYSIVASVTNETVFTATAVRDEDSSFNTDRPVMNGGDLIEIKIPQSQITGITLSTRKTVWLSLNQELGASVNLEITTPTSFGVNKYVTLYP